MNMQRQFPDELQLLRKLDKRIAWRLHWGFLSLEEAQSLHQYIEVLKLKIRALEHD